MDGLLVTDLHTGYRKKKIIDGLTTPLLPRGKITALLGPTVRGNQRCCVRWLISIRRKAKSPSTVRI